MLLHENEKDIYGDIPSRVPRHRRVGRLAGAQAWPGTTPTSCRSACGRSPTAYAMLRPHLEYLQVKDAVAATGEVVPAGEGDGQLLETLTALRDDGYYGVRLARTAPRRLGTRSADSPVRLWSRMRGADRGTIGVWVRA